MTQSALPHLEAVPLFQFLKADERALIAPFCRARGYEKGEMIFAEGDRASELCFMVFGRAKIVKEAQGRTLILGLFGPGEPIGVVAVLEGGRYPATAVALEPSTVLHVPERELFTVLDRHPEITRSMLRGLILRQLELTRRLADLTGPVEYRVARLFVTLAERAGKPAGDGCEIPIALSRQEIADLAATTIETAIRVMSRWGKDGLVLTHPVGFTVPDLPALRRLAREEVGAGGR